MDIKMENSELFLEDLCTVIFFHFWTQV